MKNIQILNFRPRRDRLSSGTLVTALFDVQLRDLPIRLHDVQLRKKLDGSIGIYSAYTRDPDTGIKCRAYTLGGDIAAELTRSANQILEGLNATVSTVRAAA